jgi:hypothetical protein
VGGAKLSRGYTVEGLTVSYYRRPTGAGDTLMQMGRWFGFRPGYRDLVRLFIGSKEPKGRVLVDLYEAFGAVCKDEEALRSELRKYSADGLLPKQVPPLVRQHLPNLPPTSRNKMFNAEIRSRDFAGDWKEKTSAPTAAPDVQANLALARALLEAGMIGPETELSFNGPTGSPRKFSARLGVVAGNAVLAFLKGYAWADGRQSVSLESAYIEAKLKAGEFGEWLIVLPQLGEGIRAEALATNVGPISVIERARVSESRFGAYSEPRHREAVAFLGGVGEVTNPSRSLKAARKPDTPILLLYLVAERGVPKSQITIGFGVQYPGLKKLKDITWMVVNRQRPDDIVVSGRKT